MIKPNKGDKVFFARHVDGQLVCRAVTVHNVVDEFEYFTALEPFQGRDGVIVGDGMTFLFNFKDMDKCVFDSRDKCNEYIEELEKKYGRKY